MMHTYLAILDCNHGGWVDNIDSLFPAYVFTALNDKWALTFVLEFVEKERKERGNCTLSQLSRITQGIELETLTQEKVGELLKSVTKKEIADCSPTPALLKTIEFTRLSAGSYGVRNAVEHIQPFDHAKQNKRFVAQAKFDTELAEEQKRIAEVPLPKIGDDIYVGSSLHVYRGRDDFAGGLARVIKVIKEDSNGNPTHFISIKERPGTSYNWESLALRQEELKKEFGKERAHPDPDLRPEFNDYT